MQYVLHNASLIQSFSDRSTEAFFRTGRCPPEWSQFRDVVARKLISIDSASAIGDLRVPPGNRLEALRGDRDGQWSIRINRQWRICFRWGDDGPEDVEIVDYH